jgi:hypothetical protein
MKAAPHVRANVTSDGVVLLDVDKGSIFSANVVGARIWQRLLDGHSETAIVDALVEEFKAPRATVEQDVREFVESLRAQALLADTPRVER